ncbi:uncharacterized protein LOC122056560 [Zingiber officinale]|uniref:uncharacterized protein LOC122056560 n=1 Tax=Zingiber officinale TaxID=94328 RepID=UPI001C4D755D|nr:uncharacterized protein LOC122056560 [Zingiber officinale]XP_042474498.1 uncharacterized protein LOC122056560 [Zingiber officinale]
MASDDYEVDHEIFTLLNEPDESRENSFELNDDFTFKLPKMIQSDEKNAVLTPEEVAWVDSCFAFGPELSDDKWTAMKDAFLDALDMYPTPSGAMENDDDWVFVEASNVTELDNAMNHDSPELLKEPAILTRQEDTNPCDSIIRVCDGLAIEHGLSGETEISAEHVSLAGVATESRADLFKVWDLETLVEEDEEDELIAKINKLFQSRSQSQLLMKHSSLPSVQNVDELVAGLTDMSLTPLEKKVPIAIFSCYNVYKSRQDIRV